MLSKTTASHTQRCALGEGMLQTSLFQLQDAVSWAPTLRKEIQKLDATQQSSPGRGFPGAQESQAKFKSVSEPGE